MKSIYKNIEKIELKSISEVEFNNYKTLSFTIVENENSDTRNKNHTKYAFMTFDSAVKIANKLNLVTMSESINKKDNFTFIIFNPTTGEYQIKEVKKERVLTEVSDSEFSECLSEISFQKETDQRMKWFPKDENYYSIDNWTF